MLFLLSRHIQSHLSNMFFAVFADLFETKNLLFICLRIILLSDVFIDWEPISLLWFNRCIHKNTHSSARIVNGRNENECDSYPFSQ